MHHDKLVYPETKISEGKLVVIKDFIAQFYLAQLMLLSVRYHHHQGAPLPILAIKITQKVQHQKDYVFFKLTFKTEVYNALVRT